MRLTSNIQSKDTISALSNARIHVTQQRENMKREICILLNYPSTHQLDRDYTNLNTKFFTKIL